MKPLVEGFMHERGLQLSEEKTHITQIEQDFDFLGQNVRKYWGKLLIKPTSASIRDLLAHVRKVLKTNPQATAGHLIAQLNPILRGWAMYPTFPGFVNYCWVGLLGRSKRKARRG